MAQNLARMVAASLTAFTLTAGAAFAQPIALSELSRYFNSFRTAQADFTQINADGTLSTGQLTIHRPGRIRFAYDAPDNTLVLSADGNVNIFDARSNSGPSIYPLARTPLSLILSETVDLRREQMVVSHREDGPTTVVRAQDPEHPEYGSIDLVFSARPTELRQWIITDDTGAQTTVILGTLETDVPVNARLFSLNDELTRRGLRVER